MSGWRYVVRLLEYRDGEPYIVSEEGGMETREMRQQVDTLIKHVSQIYRVEIERYDPRNGGTTHVRVPDPVKDVAAGMVQDGELDAKACLLEEYREAETAAGYAEAPEAEAAAVADGEAGA